MDTKGPISPSSQNKSYIFVIIDAFSHFVVTNPAPHITSKYAIQTLLHHWITKFGPPQYLVTDRGTEYTNQDMAHLCSLFHINHSHRTPYSPWTNGLVEVQNRNLGTHLRIFLQNLLPIGHFKHKCMHMLIIRHLFLNLNFLLIRLFSILILVYLSPFLLTYLVMLQKFVSQLIVNLFPPFPLQHPRS